MTASPGVDPRTAAEIENRRLRAVAAAWAVFQAESAAIFAARDRALSNTGEQR